MSKMERYVETDGDGGFLIQCPGCNDTHMIPIGNGGGPRWVFKGNEEAPTFSPSLLCRSGHYAGGGSQPGNCWCDYEDRLGKANPHGFSCRICHSFIVDGKIQFLGDCTHALAGQTVDLPEFPE